VTGVQTCALPIYDCGEKGGKFFIPKDKKNRNRDFFDTQDSTTVFDSQSINESEEDDLEWIRNIQTNPFIVHPNVVVFINNTNVDKGDLEKLFNLIENSGVYMSTPDRERLLNAVYTESPDYEECYVRVFEVRYGRKVTYGHSREIFLEAVTHPHKYVEYTLSDIIGKQTIYESENDDLDWIREVPPVSEWEQNALKLIIDAFKDTEFTTELSRVAGRNSIKINDHNGDNYSVLYLNGDSWDWRTRINSDINDAINICGEDCELTQKYRRIKEIFMEKFFNQRT